MVAVTTLHSVVTSIDPKVEVIFVHGLDGHYMTTWRMNEAESWQKWIQEECRSANIWSLEYRIRSSKWAGGSMSLPQRSRQILHVIEDRVNSDRPIVFVCHSYGGILVKMAIRSAKTGDGRFLPLISRVRSVVFFSTPHLGSAIPAYFAQIDRISSVPILGGLGRLLMRPSSAVDELRENSEQMTELSLWYEGNSNYPQVNHLVYCEALPTKGFHVVPFHSGRIPNMECINWDTDHIDICKPVAKQDLRVTGVIGLVKDATGQSAVQRSTNLSANSSVIASTRDERERIVVIGALMADIVITPEGSQERRDKIGNVEKVKVGGCAFNIFWRLRKNKIDCSLFSVIPVNSPFAPMMLEALAEAGGDKKFIKLASSVPEPVFIAQRSGTGLRSCLSSTCIEHADLDLTAIEKELKRALVAIIDLSLSPRQIVEISTLCRRYNVDLICNGTSDGRIGRLMGLKGERIDVLTCAEDEFEALTSISFESAVKISAQEVCGKAFSKKLIVTRGPKGFAIFDPQEREPVFFGPGTDQDEIVSTMGVGDAFTACFGAMALNDIMHGRAFSSDTLSSFVKEWLPPVLGEKYST